MGIEPWSLDFPDAEALINTGMDPATPNAPPNLTRFGDKAFIPAFNDAAAAAGHEAGAAATSSSTRT